MKFTKNKVFVVALAVCVLAILSMGTLAWFSAADSVENKFLVASSDGTTVDKDFSVAVWENTPDGNNDPDGFVYENIMPGDTLKKEVRVENTGDYDQYVRLTVTISNAEQWINALGASFDPITVFDEFDSTKWCGFWNNLNGASIIPQDIVYVMYYKDVLSPNGVIEVFDNIKIPTSLTYEQAVTFGGNFSITVKADAVQTANVGVDSTTPVEEAAKTAFETVGI